jgi:hypothetical protein
VGAQRALGERGVAGVGRGATLKTKGASGARPGQGGAWC